MATRNRRKRGMKLVVFRSRKHGETGRYPRINWGRTSAENIPHLACSESLRLHEEIHIVLAMQRFNMPSLQSVATPKTALKQFFRKTPVLSNFGKVQKKTGAKKHHVFLSKNSDCPLALKPAPNHGVLKAGHIQRFAIKDDLTPPFGGSSHIEGLG